MKQGRAEHQHSQAIQLFSMTILHDLRVTVCVCSEGSALFHIRAKNYTKHLVKEKCFPHLFILI